MGRITLFTLDECNHCKRIKATFQQNDIPYKEISLSKYPYRRNDMLQLSDRLTVPQVFFNSKHIGGANETMEYMQIEKWLDNNNNNNHGTAKDKYDQTISNEPDPIDQRLRLPTEKEESEVKNQERLLLPSREKQFLSLPIPISNKQNTDKNDDDDDNNKTTMKVTLVEITELLKRILPRRELKYYMKNYKNSFTGKEFVDCICEEYSSHLKNHNEAIELGNYLIENHIIHHVVDDHKNIHYSNSYYYRLHCDHTPNVLNSYCHWMDNVDNDHIMYILKKNTKLLNSIVNDVTTTTKTTNGINDKTNNKTKLSIQYYKAIKHENFPNFEESICELQGVDLSKLDENTKLAFGINVYNLMIKYAFIKVGIPMSDLNRSSFFNNVSFNIGNHIYTFSEWENGILRSNRKAPYSLMTPFNKRNDKRHSYKCTTVDYRIHFALNCGAKSCPPIKQFTSQAINEELRIVTQAFMEDDDNITIDEEKNILKVNKILSWYKQDFEESTSDNNKLQHTILKSMRNNTKKKEKLQSMIDSNKPIKIIFKPYDWTVPDVDFNHTSMNNNNDYDNDNKNGKSEQERPNVLIYDSSNIKADVTCIF